MDLEIMAQVQENIIGNCLCVLGDSMAMPIGSMIEKFRAGVRGAHRARRAPARARAAGCRRSAPASSAATGEAGRRLWLAPSRSWSPSRSTAAR